MLSVLAICTGASLGALARWQLGLWLSTAGGLPWGTLAANAIGGYGIGLVLATLQSMPDISPLWRLALVTGFLGALTTFSTFSAEVIQLLQAQRWWTAIAWAGTHLLLSLLLTIAGMASVQAMR